MAYCGPIGLPHSRFLGWDELDQDKSIAWMLDERAKCPECGTYPDEWLDDSGRDVDPPPYVTEIVRCIGCVHQDDAHKRIPKDLVGAKVRFVPFDGESYVPEEPDEA